MVYLAATIPWQVWVMPSGWVAGHEGTDEEIQWKLGYEYKYLILRPQLFTDLDNVKEINKWIIQFAFASRWSWVHFSSSPAC